MNNKELIKTGKNYKKLLEAQRKERAEFFETYMVKHITNPEAGELTSRATADISSMNSTINLVGYAVNTLKRNNK